MIDGIWWETHTIFVFDENWWVWWYLMVVDDIWWYLAIYGGIWWCSGWHLMVVATTEWGLVPLFLMILCDIMMDCWWSWWCLVVFGDIWCAWWYLMTFDDSWVLFDIVVKNWWYLLIIEKAWWLLVVFDAICCWVLDGYLMVLWCLGSIWWSLLVLWCLWVFDDLWWFADILDDVCRYLVIFGCYLILSNALMTLMLLSGMFWFLVTFDDVWLVIFGVVWQVFDRYLVIFDDVWGIVVLWCLMIFEW